MEERRILRMEREGAYMRSTKYIPEVYTTHPHPRRVQVQVGVERIQPEAISPLPCEGTSQLPRLWGLTVQEHQSIPCLSTRLPWCIQPPVQMNQYHPTNMLARHPVEYKESQ